MKMERATGKSSKHLINQSYLSSSRVSDDYLTCLYTVSVPDSISYKRTRERRRNKQNVHFTCILAISHLSSDLCVGFCFLCLSVLKFEWILILLIDNTALNRILRFFNSGSLFEALYLPMTTFDIEILLGNTIFCVSINCNIRWKTAKKKVKTSQCVGLTVEQV